MKVKNLLIFDIDGTLINTEKSYLEAIKLTVEYFIKKQLDKQKVSDIKMLSGFNNDWLAAYALTNSELTGKNVVDFKEEYSPFQKVAFVEIKEIFQAFYLGNKLYQEIEGSLPKIDIKVGLWEKEEMIFSREQLAVLADKFGKFNIITGRTYKEAVHIIEYFGLQDLFNQIISVEDITNDWLLAHPELSVFGKDKANPILLYQIDAINNFKQIYYIGDGISDMELVFNAKRNFPINSIHFLHCFEQNKRELIKVNSARFSPDKTFNNASDICDYLLSNS